MALELYDLVSLRTRCAEEFGLDLADPNVVDVVDRRINDAVTWIINRRKNWPWLDAETVIEIGEPSSSSTDIRYGSGFFTKMSRYVNHATFSQTPALSRDLVVFDSNGGSGTLITDVTGTVLTLESAHTGSNWKVNVLSVVASASPTSITVELVDADGEAVTLPVNVASFYVTIAGAAGTGLATAINGTNLATRTSSNTFTIAVSTAGATWTSYGTATIAREFIIGQGFFALPDDFIRSDAVHLDSATDDYTLYYRDPTSWKRETRSARVVGGLERIYTVVPDPLKATYSKYLAVYPYFTDRNIIYVKYWRDARKMVGDYDEPDVPRSDRMVVLYAAYWFVAQWQQSELVTFYRDGAMNELERMAKEYQFSDDMTEDMSMDGDSNIGPVQGPFGFPRMTT